MLRWLAEADLILAADGAADLCLRLGFQPHLTVGDLDSLKANPKNLKEIEVIDDQNFTDCDKLLTALSKHQEANITLIGLEGDRPDHFLSSLLSVARVNIRLQIGFSKGYGTLLVSGQSTAFTTHGTTSMLPLEACTGACLLGTKWPLSDADLSLEGSVSISNRGLGPCQASLRTGAAFLFVESSEMPNWEFFHFD